MSAVVLAIVLVLALNCPETAKYVLKPHGGEGSGRNNRRYRFLTERWAKAVQMNTPTLRFLNIATRLRPLREGSRTVQGTQTSRMNKQPLVQLKPQLSIAFQTL